MLAKATRRNNLLAFKKLTKVVGVGSVGTHLGPSAFRHHGQRVVEGQRLIQATSDVLLGWSHWTQPGGRNVNFYSVSSPALTQPTTSTVVTDDDWVTAVTMVPVMAPRMRLPVSLASSTFSGGHQPMMDPVDSPVCRP